MEPVGSRTRRGGALSRPAFAVPVVAAAVVLAGCGTGGGSAEPDGELRPLGFGASQRIELMVPDGWDMINQEDLQEIDAGDPPRANGVTYALVDRSRISEDLSRAVPGDENAGQMFREASLRGAAVTAEFSELVDCDAVDAMVDDSRDAVDPDSSETLDDGLGEGATLSTVTGEDDGEKYRYVQYHSSVQLTEGRCVALRMQSTLLDPDDDTVDEASDVITRVAEQSQVTEAGNPDDGNPDDGEE